MSHSAQKTLFSDVRTTTFNDRYGSFFVDYDMVPLLVQQALPQSVQSVPGETPTSRLTRMADGLDAVVAGDLMSNVVRSRGHWGLLTSVAAMNVKAAYHACGSVAFPGFPEWFGKNSTTGKRRRLLGELSMHMNHRVSGGTLALRMHYMSAMRATMYAPLVARGAEGVQDTIDLLDAYGLSKQDLTESCVPLSTFAVAALHTHSPIAGWRSFLSRALRRTYMASCQGL